MILAGPISLAVVDDHPLFRAGVIQSLRLDDDIDVIGEGASKADAVALARSGETSIMLLDISMPGNGLAAVEEILAAPSPPKVIMLTASDEDEDVMQALRLGAVGYILKGIGAPELLSAIRAVASGESFISPNLALKLLSPRKAPSAEERLADLTRQEQKILALVATGLSNREVGEEIGILERTVKYHMTRIMEKLGVKNRVQATLIAREAGAGSGI